MSETAKYANVVLPGASFFEKSGTFVNQQFRLQKFARAVPGPHGVADDLVTLSRLLAALGGALSVFYVPAGVLALGHLLGGGQ